jgi:hypothetical protein
MTASSKKSHVGLKTCTLGHFALTIAPNVDLWYVDAVKDMEEWSKRLAEELK